MWTSTATVESSGVCGRPAPQTLTALMQKSP
jgi:hypothetical protein